MHIQKRMLHWYAWILIATILVNVFSSKLVVDAQTFVPPVPEVTSLKLIDMCLTRSGKVVNSDIRDDVLIQTRNVLNDTAQSYWQWCSDNGKQKSVETFREYLESDAYASLPFRLSKYPLNLASFINWIITGETLLDVLGTDVNDVLIEYDDNGNATVPSESVNIINQSFDKVKGNYASGYFYKEVKPYTELPVKYFGTPQAWENAKAYIASSDNPTLVLFHANKKPLSRDGCDKILFGDNTLSTYLIAEKTAKFGQFWNGDNGYKLKQYDEKWVETFKFATVQYGASQVSFTDSASYLEVAQETTAITDKTYYTGYYVYNPNQVDAQLNYAWWDWEIYGKEYSQVMIYESLEAIKQYSCGQQPYYLTNRQYQDSVDNSFNVSGEYIHNDGGTFAYEQIREQINNSSVTNDNSANSIINDYSQTIINNYNYSSGGSGEGGEGDNEDGNGILDGIASVLDGLTEIVGFLLQAIGSILSLIADLFNTILDAIKAVGGIFAGFTGLLADIFPFIPSELVTFVTLAIEATVAITVWKQFKK